MSTKQTNYSKHMEEILKRCQHGACYDCLARKVCSEMCKERGIDPSKQTPPCYEAWLSWAEKTD